MRLAPKKAGIPAALTTAPCWWPTACRPRRKRMTECRQIPWNAVKTKAFPPDAAPVWRGGRAEIGGELLKNGRGSCPYGAFFRLVSGRVESGGKRGFGRLFPSGWGLPACKIQLSFCQPFPLAGRRGGGTRPHGVPWQSAKCSAKRPPAFILRSRGAARFAYFRPSPSPLQSVRFSRGWF